MLQQSNYKSDYAISWPKSFAVTVAAVTISSLISVVPVSSDSDGGFSSENSDASERYVAFSNATRSVRIADLLSSTAVYALMQLDQMAMAYPELIGTIDDARSFANSLPLDLPKPEIWTDEDSEVAFEWKYGTRHAMVSFQGAGSFGYALRRGNRFVPGTFPGDLKSGIPRDLINYLFGKTPA